MLETSARKKQSWEKHRKNEICGIAFIFYHYEMGVFKMIDPLFSCGHAILKETLLVRRSVGRSVEMIKSKSGNMSVLDIFYGCLCMEWGLSCEWGLDAPAHPPATIL